MRRVATRLQCISSSKNRNDACTKILIKASFSVIKRDFLKNRGVVCCWLDGCGMRGVTLAWKKRERDRDRKKKKKSRQVPQRAKNSPVFMFVLWILSAWLENFLHSPCRYFSNTSALWKADSADFVAAQKQKHHSPFFVFVWEFKKKKRNSHTRSNLCSVHCTAARYGQKRVSKREESRFIGVYSCFFPFLLLPHTEVGLPGPVGSPSSQPLRQ